MKQNEERAKIEKELKDKVEKQMLDFAGWWWCEQDPKKLNKILGLKASVIIKLVRKNEK